MIFKGKKDVLNGNITEQIVLFTMPILWSYLLQQLYQWVDSIVLGRYAGVEAMAAVGGSATMVVNILINLITGIAAGIMIVVAQAYGRDDREKVRQTVRTSVFIAVVFGGIISILSIVLAKPILVFMKCPEETIELSLIYMYLYFASIIPYSIYIIGNFILRATGDLKISTFFTVIIAIIKIILDIILTKYLRLGVWGVAIATLVSYLVCSVVVLMILKNTEDCYHFEIKEFGFDLYEMKHIFKIGVPVAIQNVIFALTNAYVAIRINEHGTKIVAAYTAYNNIDTFYWSFSNAIGAAITSIVGQNYGNKNMKRVKEILKYGIIIDLIVSIVISIFVVGFGRVLISLFTTDETVIQEAVKLNSAISVFYIAYVLVEMISSTIKGCGDSMSSMIIATIGICVVRFIYLSVFKFNNAVEVVFNYPISWIITSLIYLTYYLLNKKYKLPKNS